MPIREESFRIGSGRYLQKPDLINEAGTEIIRFSNKALLVGGKTALSKTQDALQKSLVEVDASWEIIEHTGSCNFEDAECLAEKAKREGFGVIVGIGGGVIMDFAKLIADIAKLPIVNIPTQSATCAAYTPLSVCYTKSGETVGSHHLEKEVDAVLVDTNLLLNQPPRLLLAGVFDALAKFIEIKQRFNPNQQNLLGLDWAHWISKRSFEVLLENINKVIEDMKLGKNSDVFEQVIFTTIAVTGVISGIARGSNQCALAHKFYETARKLYNSETKAFLHGELVGMGLLLQNHFNGEASQNEALISVMKQNGMPYRVEQVNLSKDAKQSFYNAICGSSAVDKNNAEECEKFKNSLDYFWSI